MKGIKKRIIKIIRNLNAKRDDNERDITLNLLIKIRDKMDLTKNYKAENYINTSIYILIVNRDIFNLFQLYNFENNGHKKNLYGRLLTMTIIEYLEDVNYLIGNKMIKEVVINKWNKDLIIQLKSVSKLYSTLKSKYEKKLREVRNNAAAHKNKDTRKLVEFTTMKFEYLSTLYPLLRIIEGEFEKVSMMFDEIV